jgi:DNA polymerase III subunit delta'
VNAPAAGLAPMPWLVPVVEQASTLQRAHALLLHGASGDGLYPAARLIARSWLCEAKPSVSSQACGQCAGCRQFDHDAHPDVHLLLPEQLRQQLGVATAADGADGSDGEGGGKSRRKPSRQIRIDEVRAGIDWIVTSSSRGRGKVLLIHPAEAMNVAAANALLKTLEEPPPGARLLLTVSDPERLLPTVRSRCQVLRVRPPTTDEARAWLLTQGLKQPEVLLAACSQRPLDALALSADGVDAARWAAVPAAVSNRQAASFAGWGPARVLDALQKLCHDGLALSAGGQARYFPSASMSRPVSMAALATWAKALNQLARRIDHPWNEGLLVEAMLQQAHAAWHGRVERSDTLGA